MKKDAISAVVDWVNESRKMVVLTGVELSAESGLPDFSDPRLNPQIRDFRENRSVRTDYWNKVRQIYPTLANAQPNAAHDSLAELEILSNLDCIFTQCADGLHHLAGSSTVIELHGTMLWIGCTSCGKDYPTDSIQNMLEKGVEIPECENCGNDVLKPPIPFPGQPNPHWEVREAWMRLHHSDLFMAIGANLDIQPVASFPIQAREQGAKVVIISERQSQSDDYVHAVIYGKPSKVLPHIVKKIKEGISVS